MGVSYEPVPRDEALELRARSRKSLPRIFDTGDGNYVEIRPLREFSQDENGDTVIFGGEVVYRDVGRDQYLTVRKMSLINPREDPTRVYFEVRDPSVFEDYQMPKFLLAGDILVELRDVMGEELERIAREVQKSHDLSARGILD